VRFNVLTPPFPGLCASDWASYNAIWNVAFCPSGLRAAPVDPLQATLAKADYILSWTCKCNQWLPFICTKHFRSKIKAVKNYCQNHFTNLKMGLFKSTQHESNIAPAQAAVTSDERSDNLPRKQPENVNEKTDWNVVVSETAQTPVESRSQRYARRIRSIFTAKFVLQTGEVLWKFGKFTGPGAIISVAYIDPDNYQTAVSAGAEFKFKLLFMILFSNVVAVYLQVSMVILYLGIVADETRRCLPSWAVSLVWIWHR
jgi:hypothetical protein